MNFRNRKVACIITCILILLVTPFSIHRSFQKKQQVLNDLYYSEPNIKTDLDRKVANANNLAVIAQRYNVSTHQMMACADALKYASISEAREQNEALEKAFIVCREQLLIQNLSEKDHQYVVGIDSEFAANQDRIDRSSYHDEVEKLHHELQQFPTQLLQSLLGFTFEIY